MHFCCHTVKIEMTKIRGEWWFIYIYYYFFFSLRDFVKFYVTDDCANIVVFLYKTTDPLMWTLRCVGTVKRAMKVCFEKKQVFFLLHWRTYFYCRNCGALANTTFVLVIRAWLSAGLTLRWPFGERAETTRWSMRGLLI